MTGNEARRYILPNRLQERIGGPLPESGSALIAAANKELDTISGRFGNWLDDEIARLDQAYRDFCARSDRATAVALHDCAHDLKGIGSTLGYPFASRLAASLCRLMLPVADGSDHPKALIKAHVDAIRASARAQIRAGQDQVAISLASELERRVADLGP